MDQRGTGGPSAGQTVKESATAKIAARRPSKASRNRGFHATSVNIVTKSSARSLHRMPQTGTGGPSVGRKEKESALAKSSRAAPRRQAAIAAVAGAHQVLVNALIQAPSLERRPRGSGEHISSTGLWPSVAVSTRTSAMEAEIASSKTRPRGHDRKPDNLAEQPSRLGVGAGSVRVFPGNNARRNRSHSPAHAPRHSQRTAGERRGDIRRRQLWAHLRGAARPSDGRDLPDHERSRRSYWRGSVEPIGDVP